MSSQETIKQELYRQCESFVDHKLKSVRKNIKELQEALQSETKSTAGDKHETGRAMLQLEREKTGNQLAEIEKTQRLLSKINIENTNETIGLGSVVYTSQANYFIAISAGELIFENEKFYAISAHTPIGQLLMQKSVGDEVVFRGNRFKIKRVL